jgi:Na+-driven multidrug efflux pump
MVTVISQCVGARDFEQVRYYAKKLMKLGYAMLIGFNIAVLILLPLILEIYGLSDEATRLGRMILIYHSICAMLIWAPSFTMPYVLRAANDVAPTMIISIISMWVFRVVSSYILGGWLGMGLFGVWVAMTIDWLFRAVCFVIRYKREKWVVKRS